MNNDTIGDGVYAVWVVAGKRSRVRIIGGTKQEVDGRNKKIEGQLSDK